MTMQQRMTIDPTDVLAIEYQCKKCKLRHVVAIEGVKKSQMECPNCGAEWVKGRYTGGPERTDTAVYEFANALIHLRSMALADAELRIEIVTPVKS